MKRFWLRYRLAGVVCTLIVLVASPSFVDLEARTAAVVGVAVAPDETVHEDPVELSWRALAALD